MLKRVIHDAEAWLLVGSRLPLDLDVWRHIMEFALPIAEIGYRGHRLRVTLRGDDREWSSPWVPEVLLPRKSRSFHHQW